MKFVLGLLAALPARAGYALSRICFVLLFYIVRYRRSVVQENLGHAFPHMPATARAELEYKFYRHFCDLIVEVLRSSRMTEEEFSRRVCLSNTEVLAEATEGYSRQAIILLIHQGNWEWMLHGAMLQLPVSVDPVYQTLHSPFWDEYMLKARSRFGARAMSKANVGRELISGRKRKRIIAMIADQSGSKHEGYWTEFLHRPASFHRGAETLAQRLKLPVLFAQCLRQSQGHYEVRFHPLSLPPHSEDGEAILESYVRTAEAMIAEQPETYLWTNRRWKKTPPTNPRKDQSHD